MWRSDATLPNDLQVHIRLENRLTGRLWAQLFSPAALGALEVIAKRRRLPAIVLSFTPV